MAHLSLYRKYRPGRFADILGQDHVAKTLANAITEDRVAHAYLFTGPRGTGKTSTARILAKSLNCEKGPTPDPCGVCDSCRAIADGSSLDVIEMDAASHSKVEQTRDVLAGVPLTTAGGGKKVYVVDEVHMLSAPSFNALLKTLEEPPPHVIFVLATTEAHKVLDTIVSRTQRFDFRRIPAEILQRHLARIAEAEGIDVDEAALSDIARRADGSARDALSALDQLANLGGRISAAEADAVLGERREDAFVELFDAIAGGDIGAVFLIVSSLVSQGADVRQLVLGAMRHARSLLLLKTAPDAGELLDETDEDRSILGVQAERFSTSHILRTLDLVAKSLTEMRNAPHHRLLFEVALVRAAAPEMDPSADGLLGRIERLERRLGISSGAAPHVEVTRGTVDAAGAEGPEPDARPEPVPASPGGSVPAPVSPPAPAGEGAPLAESASAPAAEAEPGPDSVDAPPPAPANGRSPAPPGASSPVDGAPSGVPPQVGLGDVRDAWQATLQETKRRSKRVWGMLNPSRPVLYDEGRLQVEVQSEFHESSMSEERNRRVLEDSLHAALGVRPVLVFSALKKSEEPGASEAAAPRYDDARATEANDDPIELVKKGLGAEVVDQVPH